MNQAFHFDRPQRRPRRWGRAATAVLVSVCAHLLVVLAMLWPQGSPLKTQGVAEVTVALVEGPPIVAPPAPPQPKVDEPKPPKPAKAKPARAKAVAKPADKPQVKAARAMPDSQRAEKAAGSPGPPGPSESELAQASTAASAPSGGQCNMARLLQAALRRDSRAQALLAAHRRVRGGQALMVWNGNWVRDEAEEGDGLAGLRETMIVEIGFAPKECRTQAVRGLVLLSMNDGPGAPRVVLGAATWRWSDLLMLRPEHAGESFR